MSRPKSARHVGPLKESIGTKGRHLYIFSFCAYIMSYNVFFLTFRIMCLHPRMKLESPSRKAGVIAVRDHYSV